MTNKPMLSVELRELLESISSGAYCKPAVMADLRALLDKEVDMDYDASKHQGEPVAWRYKKSWEKTGWKVCDKHPTDYGIDDECYEIQALYAEQPAPVADHTQCEECKGWGYHENHYEGGGTECGECGGSGNASVAVFMPDVDELAQIIRKVAGSHNLGAGSLAEAILEEVARLNGLKP